MSNHNKTLYLVRHAKSSWKDASLRDIERPLNGRGRRNSPDMGKRMLAQGHFPDLIISSPANRANSTARNIAAELDIEPSEILLDDDLYFSGTDGMLNTLENTEGRFNRIMMVGHNPTVTSLTNQLAGTRIWNMPTCAIAIIGFNIDSWDEVPSAGGELLGYDTPKGTGSFTR